MANNNISIILGAELDTSHIETQIDEINEGKGNFALKKITVPAELDLKVNESNLDKIRLRVKELSSEIDFSNAFDSMGRNMSGLTTQIQKISAQMESVLTTSIKSSFDKALMNGWFDKVDFSTLESNIERIVGKAKEIGGVFYTAEGLEVAQWEEVEAELQRIKPILANDVELMQKFYLVMMNAPDGNAMLNYISGLSEIADRSIIGVNMLEALGESATTTDGVIGAMARDMQASANAMASVEQVATSTAQAENKIAESTQTANNAINQYVSNVENLANAESQVKNGIESTALSFDKANSQYQETINLSAQNTEAAEKECQQIRILTNAMLKMNAVKQSISSINSRNGGSNFYLSGSSSLKFFQYLQDNLTESEKKIIGLTDSLDEFRNILSSLQSSSKGLIHFTNDSERDSLHFQTSDIKAFLASQKKAIADTQQFNNEIVKLENALKRAFNIDTSSGSFTVTLDQLRAVVAEAPLAQQFIDEIESRFQTLGQTSQTATAEMTSGVQTANTSLAEYAQYSGQLVSNTESVANAEKYLATSMEQVATAEQQVSTAMQTATQSEQSATQAVGTMDSQLGDFQSRLNTVSSALTAFSEGIQNLTQLNEVFGRFNSSITSFNTAITRLETAISGIGTAIESGFGSGDASLTTFNNNLSNVVTTVENMASSTIAFTRDMANGLANINPDSINLTPITDQLTNIFNIIQSIVDFVNENLPAINNNVETLFGIIGTSNFEPIINQITTVTQLIESVINFVNENLPSLNSNTSSFYSILSDINSNITAVNNNLTSISESMLTAFTGVIGEINQVTTAIGNLNQAETQAENNAQAFANTMNGVANATRNVETAANNAANATRNVIVGNYFSNNEEILNSIQSLGTDGERAILTLKNAFNQLGATAVDVNQNINPEGLITGFVANIRSATGEVERFVYAYTQLTQLQSDGTVIPVLDEYGDEVWTYQLRNIQAADDGIRRLNESFNRMQQNINANADKMTQKLDNLRATFVNFVDNDGLHNSSKKPIRETEHIENLANAYDNVVNAVEAYRTANAETMTEARSQVEIALSQYEALGKQYQNLEYLATELRTKDFGEVRNQWGDKLRGFINEVTTAQSKAEALGLTIQGLNVDIRGLENEFTNISTTSDTGSNQLKAFLTTFSNAKVQFQQGTKELQIYEQNQSKLSATLKSSENAMRSLTTAQNTLNKMGTDTNVSQTKVTVGELITELTTLQNEIRSIGVNDTGGITSVSQRMNELKARIDTLTTSVRSLKSNFSQTQDMEKFESKLEILKNKVAYFSKMNNKSPTFNTKIRELAEQLNSLENGDTAGLARLTNQFRVLQSQMKATGSLGLSIFGKLKQQISMFTMYFSAFTIVMRTISTVKEAITTINELDTALVDLKKTFQGTQEEMEQFYYTSNKVAKELGVTTQSVIEQASAWSRLGFSTAEAAESMSKLSSQFTVISPGMTTDEATDALVSVMKAFDYAPNEVLSEVMDKINIIGNTASTSNKEIANMLQKSSSAMKEANNTLEETIALETAAVEITRDSDSVGNAFKTISMRLRGYNEETESFTEDVEILSGKIADLTKTASAPGGISLFTDDTKTEYKSTYQILKDISEIYDDLTDAQQAPLLEALAGKRQGQIVAATLSNFEAVEQALKNMEEASGSADRELQVYQESMAYKSNLLKETWTGFWQSFLQRDELKEFMDTAIELSETLVREFEKLSPIVDVFSEMFKAITKVVDALGGLGTVLTTMALNTAARGTGFFGNQQMFTVITNGATTATGKIQLFGKSLSDINRDYKLMSAKGGIFSKNGLATIFGTGFTKLDTNHINQYLTELQTAADNGSTSVIQFGGAFSFMSTQGQKAALQLQALNADFAAGRIEQSAYRAKLAELGAQFQTLSIEEQVAARNARLMGLALNTAINVGIVLAITAIVTAIQKAKQAEEELRQSIQETADEIKTETEKISELTEEYKNQYEEYQKLLEKEQDATSIKESLDKTTQNLLKSLGVEDTEIQKLIGDYQTLNDKIDEYNLKKAKTNKDDLTQEVVAEKKELRDAVGFWSNNDFAYNSFKNWAADEGDEVAKQVSSIMYDVANKYNNVIETTQEFLKNGETGDLLTLTFSTNDNYQSIKQTIDAYDYFISEIEKLDKSLWGNEDGAYYKLWSDAVNEKNKIKSALGEYEDALNAESDNLSTIYILTQKQNNELPKTIDEYKKFRQAIIDAAKAGKQGQYSIDADIEASIDRVLAGMSEFQNFISATNTEAETNITLTFAISDEDLKKGINQVKETIDDTVKNADIFDKALESLDKGESISFDDMQKLIGFGVSPQDFAKTADGYTIAFDKLSTARQDYINSTYDDIEKIKSKNVGFRTQIEENIKSLEKQRDLYIEVINSSNSKKVSEYNQAIQVQVDLLNTLNDVNAESDLILSEVSDAYVAAKQAIVDMNTALDDCDKKTKTIKTAMSEMNEDGHISASTYAEIAAKGSDYAECLSVVDGKLTVNVTKLKELEKQEYLNAISANKLTIATLQLAATSTAASGGDVSGIVAQIDTLVKENKVYLALIDEIENAKPDDKKTSSKTTDANKEAFEKLYNEKKHLLEMGRLSEKDYIDWLDGAYKQYFSDLTTYQDEYNKYEEEVFKSRKEREKDLFETKIDNYEKLADKALDNRITDFGATDEDIENLKQFNVEMQKTWGLGNVNLTNRPKVANADGSRSTVLTGTEFVWQGDDDNGQYVAIHYTPILPDGTVLDDKTLEDYLYNTLEGSEDMLKADNLGIVLKVDTDLGASEQEIKNYLNSGSTTDNIEKILDDIEKWDNGLHEVQNTWMELDDKVNSGTSYANKWEYARAQYQNMIADTQSRIDSLTASGLTNVDDEIKKLQENLDKYADKIDDINEKEISAEKDYIKELKSNYDDMMSDRIDKYKEWKKTVDNAYDKQKKAIEEQIDAIDKQKEAEESKNKILDAQKDIIEAEQKLQKASIQNKLVYTGNGNWDSRADESTKQDAEKELAEKRAKLTEAYQENVKKALEEQKDIIDKQKDSFDDYADNIIDTIENEKKTQDDIYDTLVNMYDKMNDVDSQGESNTQLTNALNKDNRYTEAINQLTDNQRKYLTDAGIIKRDESGNYKVDYSTIGDYIDDSSDKTTTALNDIQNAVESGTVDVTEFLDKVANIVKTEVNKSNGSNLPNNVPITQITDKEISQMKAGAYNLTSGGRVFKNNGMPMLAEAIGKNKTDGAYGGYNTFGEMIKALISGEIKADAKDLETVTSQKLLKKSNSANIEALTVNNAPSITTNITVEGSADQKTLDALANQINTSMSDVINKITQAVTVGYQKQTYAN